MAWLLGLQLAVTLLFAGVGWMFSGAVALTALAGGSIAMFATVMLAGALWFLAGHPAPWSLPGLCLFEVLKLVLVGWLFVAACNAPGVVPGVLLAVFALAMLSFFAAPWLPPLRQHQAGRRVAS